MKKCSIFLSLLLVLAVFASADIYIKTKAHTDAFSMMGQSQPAKDDIQEQWFGDDKFAMITADFSMIVDLKKSLMYWINPKEKTYVETTLPLDMSKLLPAEFAQMASMMQMTVTVAPNGQTKTIGQWKCTGYDVTMQMMMMTFKMTVWASTDVPFDPEKYMKMYSNVMKMQMRLDDTSLQEMAKIKGYWISSETTAEVMGAKMSSTTEVIEITKKTPDPAVYTVPAGFTKQDKLSMKDIQQR